MPNTIPIIMGPTASGKSSLAMQLAHQLNGEIISVDSSSVYKDMDIGSAKPSLKEQQQIRHHLIDIRDPSQPYSAGEFCQDALNAIADIYSRNKLPILVGGTMLYFRALLFGIAKMPKRDPKIRQQLEQEKNELGLKAMHENLSKIDPTAASRINENDWQRMERALEVFQISGKNITAWQNETPDNQFPHPYVYLALHCSNRELFLQRIQKRLDIMLKQGFLAEVEKLHARPDLNPDLPSLRAVGYSEAWQYLDGKITYQEMYEKILIATRQLAKHQMTWLKKWPNITWLECTETKKNIQTALELMPCH